MVVDILLEWCIMSVCGDGGGGGGLLVISSGGGRLCSGDFGFSHGSDGMGWHQIGVVVVVVREYLWNVERAENREYSSTV
jgi:hypothetical protein